MLDVSFAVRFLSTSQHSIHLFADGLHACVGRVVVGHLDVPYDDAGHAVVLAYFLYGLGVGFGQLGDAAVTVDDTIYRSVGVECL